MKTKKSNLFLSNSPLAVAFSVACLSHFATLSAGAATLFWSGNGTTQGGGGTWDTTLTRFGSIATGPYTLVWNNAASPSDVAVFNGGSTFTATLGSDITLGGMTQQVGGSGGGTITEGSGPFTITLGVTGSNPFSCAGSGTTGRILNLNTVIAGASGANLVLTGPGTSSAGSIALNRANTFVGGTSFSGNSSGAVNLVIGNQFALQNTTLTLSAACRTLIFNSTVAANAFTFGGLAAATTGAGRDFALQNNATTPAAIALSVGINNASTSYAAVLSGPGSLNKIGTGTLTLSGSSSFSGDTTISAGKLVGVVGGNCASSKVIISATLATFGVSVTDNTKTWTCKEFATAAAGTIEFNFGATAPSTSVSPLTINVPIALNGLANFTTTPQVVVNTDTGLVPDTYPLMTWDTVSGTIPTTVSVSNLLPQTAASLAVSGNTLNLVISSTAPTVVKANNANNVNLGTSWVGGTAPDANKTAVWNNIVTSPNTTVLGADATWSGISILNPNGLVTINGSNILTLAAASVQIDMGNATADLTLNCPLALGAANSWNVDTARTLTLGGQVSGAFAIDKLGGGTAVLSSSANSYTGNTEVSAGTLRLGANNVIPDGIGNGNVSLAGTLDLNGKSETVNGLSGAGIIDNTLAATSPTLTVGANNQTSTFAGVIQNTTGSVNLVKTGTGSLVLSSAHTLSGSVTVNGGTLGYSNIAPFANASGIALAGGTTLRSEVNGATIVPPVTVGALGTVARITAPTSAGSGTTAIPVTISSAISGAGDVTFVGLNSTNSYGTIILNGQSLYSGSTVMTCSNELATPSTEGNNNIFVRLGVTNALPTSTVLTLDGGDGGGSGRFCELNLNGNNQTLAGLTNVTGNNLRSQEIYNSSGTASTLTVNNTLPFTYTGKIGGQIGFSATPADNLGLTKSGAGTFTIAGANTYNGATTISGGTLALGALGTLPNASAVSIGAGTLSADSVGTETAGTLDVTGAATINLVAGAQIVFADSSGGGSATWAGTLTIGGFVPGSSLNFGSSSGLTAQQLGKIAATGYTNFSLDAEGDLTATVAGGFSSWITGTFANGTVPGAQQGANQDFDKDGISNLVEYAVAGEDPTVPKASVGTFAANVLSFTKRAGTSGLTYAIQDSTDLGISDAWATVTGGSYVNNATTISFTLTPGSPVRNFVRLQVLSN